MKSFLESVALSNLDLIEAELEILDEGDAEYSRLREIKEQIEESLANDKSKLKLVLAKL